MPTVMTARLNPATAMPMYYQLAQWITSRVEDGTFPAGIVLDSEPAMARDLGVSRNTVRRAKDHLANKRIIRRAKGIRHVVSEGASR